MKASFLARLVKQKVYGGQLSHELWAAARLGPLTRQVAIIIMPLSHSCYEDERAGPMVRLRAHEPLLS